MYERKWHVCPSTATEVFPSSNMKAAILDGAPAGSVADFHVVVQSFSQYREAIQRIPHYSAARWVVFSHVKYRDHRY
jgi:hypothetical protein